MFLISICTELNHIIVLDAHSHHGFPIQRGEGFPDSNMINSDVRFLEDLGFDLIVYVLPVNRSKTDNILERLKAEIKALDILSDDMQSFNIIKSPDQIVLTRGDSKLDFLFALEHFRGPIFNNDINTIVFEMVSMPSISYAESLIRVIPNKTMALIRRYFNFFHMPTIINSRE